MSDSNLDAAADAPGWFPDQAVRALEVFREERNSWEIVASPLASDKNVVIHDIREGSNHPPIWCPDPVWANSWIEGKAMEAVLKSVGVLP